MVFTAKDFIEMIEMEINWCNDNPCEVYETEYERFNEIYKLAFANGLNKAIFLINQTNFKVA